jgi:uncharacterized protein (TIGR03067 family)
MRVLRLWCAALVILVGASSALGEDEKLTPDEMALQGTWTLVTREADGKKEKAGPNPKTWVFAKQSLTINDRPGLSGRYAFLLSEKASPKEMILSRVVGGKNVRLEAIYKLNGDTLVVCIASQGIPEKFEAPKGSLDELLTFQRDKPKK